MDKKSKLILGLKIQESNRIQKKYFTEEEKRQIIEEYFLRGCTKQEIWGKYTGNKREHGHLLRWIRQYGYDTDMSVKRFKFISNQIIDIDIRN